MFLHKIEFHARLVIINESMNLRFINSPYQLWSITELVLIASKA